MIQEQILKISEDSTSPVSGILVSGNSIVCDRVFVQTSKQKCLSSLPLSLFPAPNSFA